MNLCMRTRTVFWATVSAVTALTALRLICTRDVGDTPFAECDAFRVFTWAAPILAALLVLGILWSRHRQQDALPAAPTLWKLALFALVCDLLCNHMILEDGPLLPISLFLAAALVCLLWAALGRWSLILWLPFIILEFAQHAGYFEYGSRINSLVLAESFEASGDEIFGYLTLLNMGVCLLILAGAVLLGRLLLYAMRGTQRLALVNTALICGLMATVYALAPSPYRMTKDFLWPYSEGKSLVHAYTEAIYNNQQTINCVQTLSSPAEQPSSLHTLHGNEGVVVVLHIGESVRADRMSVNGYERDTTPWLRKQERLINFSDCISSACDTCQAQIAILTDARRNLYEKDPSYRPQTGSILDLFAAHGFKIYSFFGRRIGNDLKYDRVVRLLTKQSEERYFAPASPWTSVPQMQEVLNRLSSKQNVILFINNEGSHTPFDHYDRSNPPFLPIGCSFANPAFHADEVNNAYDSTIHYTDEFVRRVTNLLRGRPWIYIYVSDHGEYLGHDGIWGRGGLGDHCRDYHSTTGCRVGMFVLTSPEFEQLHPHFAEALATLRSHTDMRVGHEHIFHTLLGVFELQTPHYSALLDLCSPHAQPYTGPCPPRMDEEEGEPGAAAEQGESPENCIR